MALAVVEKRANVFGRGRLRAREARNAKNTDREFIGHQLEQRRQLEERGRIGNARACVFDVGFRFGTNLEAYRDVNAVDR